MKTNPLHWPKLSVSLPYPRNPQTCQSCGYQQTLDVGEGRLETWREHDHLDQPTAIVVMLCPPCGKRLIEPHQRLYSREPHNKPIPGAMPHLCWDCGHRQGLSCQHPSLKANGGPGLLIRVEPPARGFWDGADPKTGKRTGGLMEIYTTPASSCAGREPEGRIQICEVCGDSSPDCRPRGQFNSTCPKCR